MARYLPPAISEIKIEKTELDVVGKQTFICNVITQKNYQCNLKAPKMALQSRKLACTQAYS